MSEQQNQRWPSSAAEDKQHPPKRRKIRKGTLSCWECKRRKTRCSYAAPSNKKCDGCRSRRTKCISQEFRDEADERVDHEESPTVQLTRHSDNTRSNASIQYQPDQERITLPARFPERDDHTSKSNSKSHLSVNAAISNIGPEAQLTTRLDEISGILLRKWPDQHDLDLILSIPVDISILFHGVIFKPYSTFYSKHMESPKEMLQLPPQGAKAHPVLIARRLLLLATYLQGIPPSSASKLDGLSSDYRAIMCCLVDVVSKLVTSNDELTNSLEGIECIMTESMYLNNSGNLRRAWMTNRRAMLTAQLLGLHTGTGGPVNIILEPKSRDRIDPDYMWFRIVLSDRALSLILGLPQGSSLDDSFASPNALESCMALERIERIQAVAAGLILRRNGAEASELSETYKIDKMLQDAAALMSPQWFVTIHNTAFVPDNEVKIFEDSIRLMHQFTHHNLLLQLHLPFILQPSSADGPNHDYSKMTASAASRTIISDFVAFHNSNPLPYYCRMIDFVVFIASVTLCIAHIDARHQHQTSSDNNCVGRGSFTALDSLRHQRMRDRGLLDYILEIMEMKARANHDIVAQKISEIIRPLLAAESDSDNGRYYLTTASRSVHQKTYSQKSQPQSLGETGETPNKLLIYIPHFGTINIEAHPEVTIGGNASILGNNPTSPSAGHEVPQDAVIEVDHIGPSDLDWQAVLSTYSNACFGSDDWCITGI
ncbi:Zn(2)-C6 fungal-type domain-containing protein [Trichoderma simmonsii]|uniref:Zn(2)-C6 fungal-type domain-containing protein n=1 Tax=Trichoderma simmonsii TaxID=1491479 RepID=A0A8G0LU03_9HYPO|nr:Zn(2)-C6 fungal-type domain-containing protein [Trichoderma simmonsii]